MSKRIALLLVMIVGLSACGYRGALYIPETPPASDTSSETPPDSPSSGDSR